MKNTVFPTFNITLIVNSSVNDIVQVTPDSYLRDFENNYFGDPMKICKVMIE